MVDMESLGGVMGGTLTANDRLRRPLLMHGDPAVEMYQPASPACFIAVHFS